MLTGVPTSLGVNRKLSIIGFWEHSVPRANGCWEWPGPSFAGSGYGRTTFRGGGWEGCHRIAYTLAKGEIEAGKIVMHSCDNKLCINPDHLSLGNHKMNARDMVSRGLHAKVAKLTDDAAAYIRFCGYSSRELADRFDVSKGTINSVRSGNTWRIEMESHALTRVNAALDRSRNPRLSMGTERRTVRGSGRQPSMPMHSDLMIRILGAKRRRG